MKTRLLLALSALIVLGCGGSHHSSSSSSTSPVKETTARTVVVLNSDFVSASSLVQHLVEFQTTTPSTVSADLTVSGLDTNDPVFSDNQDTVDELYAIARRPATKVLYGLSVEGTLYTLDTTTGAATKVATVAALHSLALTGAYVSSMAFDPVADQLRVVITSLSGSTNLVTSSINLRLNPDTGAVIATDSPFTRGGGSVAPLIAYNPAGALFALLPDSGHPADDYYELDKVADPSSGIVQRFATFPTEYYDGVGTFDISSDGTTGVFVDADDNEVYLVDLATGAPRSIGIPAATQSHGAQSVAFLDSSS